MTLEPRLGVPESLKLRTTRDAITSCPFHILRLVPRGRLRSFLFTIGYSRRPWEFRTSPSAIPPDLTPDFLARYYTRHTNPTSPLALVMVGECHPAMHFALHQESPFHVRGSGTNKPPQHSDCRSLPIGGLSLPSPGTEHTPQNSPNVLLQIAPRGSLAKKTRFPASVDDPFAVCLVSTTAY